MTLDPFLNIECAGHRLIIDARDGYYRVVCNGGIYATFNTQTHGVLEALKQAVLHAEGMERKCYEHPKS